MLCRLVADYLWLHLIENAAQGSFVCDISAIEMRARIEILFFSASLAPQIIYNRDLVSRGNTLIYNMRPDETSPTGNQNSHKTHILLLTYGVDFQRKKNLPESSFVL